MKTKHAARMLAITATMAFLTSACAAERLSMDGLFDSPVAGASLPLQDAAHVDALTLQPAPDGTVDVLVSSSGVDGGATIIHVYALGTDHPAETGRFTPPQLYPPQWAAAVPPGPVLSVALTRPGGASNPLLNWRSDKTGTSAMSRSDTFRVFRTPRAVRHAPGPPRFVAIESRAQSALVILFELDAPGRWAERVLAEDASIGEAVFMPTDSGWLLMYKMADGDGASEAMRTRARRPAGEATLGRVKGQRMSATFKAIGPSFLVAAGGPFYEFDADLQGDRLVVAGTTTGGFEVSELRLEANGLVRRSFTGLPLPAAAGAPSVLLNGGVVHVMLMKAIATPAAALLHWRL